MAGRRDLDRDRQRLLPGRDRNALAVDLGEHAVGRKVGQLIRRTVEDDVAHAVGHHLDVDIAGDVDDADVGDVERGGVHVGGVKGQRDRGDAVLRDDAFRQFDAQLVVAPESEALAQVQAGDAELGQVADDAGRTGHTQRLAVKGIVQAADIEAGGQADEVDCQRQLPHLQHGQRHIGGFGVHRRIFRGDDVAVGVAHFQRRFQRDRIVEAALRRDDGGDRGNLFQLGGRAGERDFGRDRGDAVEAEAVRDLDLRGIGRDGQDLLADFVKHDRDVRGVFHRQVNVEVVIVEGDKARGQIQRDLARAAHRGIARVDHDIAAGDVADDGGAALYAHRDIAGLRRFHKVKAEACIGAGLVGVGDLVHHDGDVAFLVKVHGDHEPGDDGAEHGDDDAHQRDVPDAVLGFFFRRRRGGRIRLFVQRHASRRLLS